jgi:hypothetical protein
MATDWKDNFKKLDAYPKTLDEFKAKTSFGGVLSLISIVTCIYLFMSEFSFYLTTEIKDELLVDTSIGMKLRINFDIVFPDMSCSVVNLDTMDASGNSQTNVKNNIYKKRLNAEGNPIGLSERNNLGETVKTSTELFLKANMTNTPITTNTNTTTTTTTAKEEKCGPCYGASDGCCNTCEEVREAYKKKGWAVGSLASIEQCVKEGFMNNLESQNGEGCNIYGFLEVDKVSGNFHFAPGQSFQHAHTHVHDLLSFAMGHLNVTHTINKLSFGAIYPGMKNPLEGYSKTSLEGKEVFQYYIKVIPTKYTYPDGSSFETNQYSVTEHSMPILGVTGGLPGLFINYDFSPIMVNIVETNRSFSHFLTAVCAIVGGVFTVMGVIDSFAYQVISSTSKRDVKGLLS